MLEFLWPKSGYARAFNYVKLRVHRIPDQPHRIARGIFAGVFVTFSPFFGLHFFLAAGLAKLMRGNIIASLFATFVGNPLTFFFIAASSLQTGNLLLGRIGGWGEDAEVHRSVGGKFVDAWGDLKHNFLAIFTDEMADWKNLYVFYDEVFFPYMVGGLVTGTISGVAFYYLSLPVIQAYQNRRRGRLKEKLLALKEKAAAKADRKTPQD
ncbi:MAG: DUF2062 domain-containing protein [Pseudomonadota bacterium]